MEQGGARGGLKWSTPPFWSSRAKILARGDIVPNPPEMYQNHCKTCISLPKAASGALLEVEHPPPQGGLEVEHPPFWRGWEGQKPSNSLWWSMLHFNPPPPPRPPPGPGGGVMLVTASHYPHPRRGGSA